MSVSDPKTSNTKPGCSGSECDSVTLAHLNWQLLSIRFDSDVFAADFGGWIEKDLASMEDRLSRFASPSNGTCLGR